MDWLLIYFLLWTIWLPGGQRQSLDGRLPGKEADKIPLAADSFQFSLAKALLGKKIALKSSKASNITQINDSAYLLLPTSVLSGKLPVTLKLRLINFGPVSSTFRDFQMVYDTVDKVPAYTRDSLKAGTQIKASVDRENEAFVINFQLAAFPVTNRVADSVPGGYTGKAPVQEKITDPQETVRYLLLWGLVLAGLFLALWVVRRYLVFYVALKPPKQDRATDKDDIDKTLDKVVNSSNSSNINTNLLTSPENLLATPNFPAEPSTMPVVPGPVWGNPAERYFFSEVMLTAGPRKRSITEPDADKDLGEDVCGFLSDGRQLLLWLLDGTSDQYCLKDPENNREYFSSRLLAQSLAYQMRSAFHQVSDKNLYECINQAVYQVKADWLRLMAKLPEAEINVLKTNIVEKNIPECATTLLFGHLSIGGELLAYRSGDSKMVFYTRQPNGNIQYIETELARKNALSNDRLFFRLVINEAGELDILYNQPKFELVQHAQVAAFIAFSDGIGPETELLLQQPPQIQLEEIRKLIIYQAQGTADDKSLCLVEIKEEYRDEESK